MTFETFRGKVQGFMQKAGIQSNCVSFYRQDGKHIAKFSTGEVITGNAISKKITVRYGSGHQMMAAI